MKMPVELISAIHLEDAYFCLSCEGITNCSDACPACGNRHLWPLQNWLGRVNSPENSRYKTPFLKEVQPARVLEIARTPSRRRYWQMVWNYLALK